MISINYSVKNMFGILLSFFLVFFCYVFFKFVGKPLLGLSFYQKQNLSCHFYPLLGTLKRAVIDQHSHLDALYSYKKCHELKHQPLEATNYGENVVISLFDPKLIKEFYAKQHNYKKFQFSTTSTQLCGTGLLFAENNLWKNHRKKVSNVFHFEFFRQNVALMVDTTREALVSLMIKPLQDVNLLEEMQKIMAEIIGCIFFGAKISKHSHNDKPLTLSLYELIQQIQKISNKPAQVLARRAGIDPRWSSSLKPVIREVKELKKICLKLIQSRRDSEQTGSQDLLGSLLQAQPTYDEPFSDEDIYNEFISFFIAGMNTTGYMIATTIYLLNKNSQFLKKIEEEITQIYNRSHYVTIEGLNQMDHMHAAFKETLRLFSPTPFIFPRVAQANHKLSNIQIKKGTLVRPAPLVNQTNEKYFNEPFVYMPERWLNCKKETDPFVYIPFSAGSRNCIGQHFAILKAKIVLSEFIKLYRIQVNPQKFKLIMAYNFLYEPQIDIIANLFIK